MDITDYEESNPSTEAVSNTRPKYQSSKGDADKRRQTSKDNMAKARQAKLEKLRLQKLEELNPKIKGPSYRYDDSSSEDTDSYVSESDDELIITKKNVKKRAVTKAKQSEDTRMDRLEALLVASLTGMKKKDKKKKRSVRKTIIQMPPNQVPQTQPMVTPNPMKEHFKQRLLLDL